jgi:hypothetical protein
MPFSRQRLLARWPEVSRRGKLQLAAYQGFLRRGILMAAIYLCFLGLVGPQLNWGSTFLLGAAGHHNVGFLAVACAFGKGPSGA